MSQPAQGAVVVDSAAASCSQGCSHRCPHCPLPRYFKTNTGLKIHLSKIHNARTSPYINVTPQAHIHDAQPIPDDPSACLWRTLCNKKNELPVVKRIPRGARSSVALALKTAVDNVVSRNSAQSWSDLFTFTYRVLHVNKDDKVSLTQKIRHNCTQLSSLQCPSTYLPFRSPKPDNFYKKVESKLCEGDIRGASKLLFSQDALAQDTEETRRALQDKHPPFSPDSQFPDAPKSDDIRPNFTKDYVLAAIMSFRPGSSAGLDGLTPQHVKDLICHSIGDSGRKLLESITSLVNLMLRGEVNEEVVAVLYGANLCALNKKDGGVRPIAVGMFLRRLSSKIACRLITPTLSARFQPLQVGFGSKGGCEAAVHTTRTFLERAENKVLLKMDVKNAFNSLDRGAMLKEVKEHIPEIFPYLWQSYNQPTKLTYKKHALLSATGCQQGDPLGPAVFSLGIHPAILEIKSTFNIWYLDDGTIGDHPNIVLNDLKSLISNFKLLGLELILSKCELYIHPSISTVDAQEIITRFKTIAPDIQIASNESLRLLGAPILDQSIPGFISELRQNFENFSSHLRKISSHCALTIIKYCLFVPKSTYALRCTHLWKFQNLLQGLDNSICQVLSTILNIPLRDRAWIQASLPVRFGGIGVRKLSAVSLPAFLSSAHACTDLFNKIVGPSLGSADIAYLSDARSEWASICPSSIPTSLTSQRLWDEILCKRVQQELINTCSDLPERARLLASFQEESDLWLNAIPSPHVGTFLDDGTLSLAIGLRLGARLVQPHECQCGSNVENLGHHGLSCQRSAGRIPRHAALNDVIRRALASANIPATLEPYGIVRSDGKRPDGLTLIPWKNGMALVWDATCVDTLAPSHVAATSCLAGAAAGNAETLKTRKYAELTDRYIFIPVGVETLGSLGPSAKKFFKDLGVRLNEATGDRRAGGFLAQRISLAIQRGNVASILGTMPHRDTLDEIFYL